MGAFQEKLRTPEIQRISVVVYANYEQAKGRIGMNADTLLPEFGVNSVKIDAPLCTKCQPSYYDGGNKNLYDGKYYGGSTVEECLLQSRETLHITGKVVGLQILPVGKSKELRFYVIPTGIGW